jgi:diguanylate cyclase (GGDEF)-like protein
MLSAGAMRLPGGRQGYAFSAVSYGRRLALFFLMIVLVPTLALFVILLLVSADSRRGKADARLAAGLHTAVALYADRVSSANPDAARLAAASSLGRSLSTGQRAGLAAFAQGAATTPGVEGVQVTDDSGRVLASGGRDDAVAFAQVGLKNDGRPAGALRVSTTTAPAYLAEARHLTGLDLVVSRAGRSLDATVTPPSSQLAPDQTEDVTLQEGDFRGHLLTLDPADRETLLLLGPREQGGLLAIGRSSAILLIGFLLLAVGFAYWLAQALTRLHLRVADEAMTDSLTGLRNRRRMSEALTDEVSRALRFDHKLSLLILDVDDFKAINDRQGHLQGDTVLQEVAAVVRHETRSIDVAARYGGDELALLLVETHRDGGTVVAERIRAHVRDTEIPLRGGGTMRVTVSVGAATLPDSAHDVDSLLDAADRALLAAKQAGKNQIRTAAEDRAAPRTPSERLV